MLLVEELAARGWPAAEAHRLDGWLLRHTPSLTRRRSNSALPLAGDRGDPALVEDFYARRGARALVQVSPAEERTGLDAELARRGWTREGTTDVLVADAGAALAGTAPGEVALTDRPDADWVAAWAACEERPDADEHARTVLAASNPRPRTPGPPGTSASGSRCASAGGRGCSASPPPRARAGAASRATWSTR